MFKSRLLFTGALLAAAQFVLPTSSQAADAPHVVASIKPIHSIAAAIMQGVGEPELLVKGAASPHTYSLRPSEASALQNADLVIYVSPDLEAFLNKPLASLSGKAKIMELAEADGISTLAMREGGAWEAHHHGDEDHHDDGDEAHDHDHDHDQHAHEHEAHDHDHDHDHEHHHDEGDPHIWMSPKNGKAIARDITEELAEIDPPHADFYRANLKSLLGKIDATTDDLVKRIQPVKDKPFIVFHDAYQYLEHSFGLQAVGSITISPDRKPGAKRLHDIEDKITSSGAACVFAEPQFKPALVQSIVADTGARIGTLDPLGANIDAGPSAYIDILSQNIDALASCLKG
ncbi:zinc ABC transporter substrate-binding protein ZnuA [Thalassospira sp. MCCC 1A01428]|uniref:zinc ABC transporter substrate-binding protein ZnuA n=1 Tax=Thalassospira sp. MCCC 1A01428 TaxID=1470575 RepID=UPI000A1EACCC|nr:zinc ABC transporter substrate-binding protein ZnuA [Thalassospira sp. MCCC 1A01428]OSQ44505.1 zinc transporter [Thalassospira sp. MCCC 1A01428]